MILLKHLYPHCQARREVLERLLPFQRSDFEGIFTAMTGLPVSIPSLPTSSPLVFYFETHPHLYLFRRGLLSMLLMSFGLPTDAKMLTVLQVTIRLLDPPLHEFLPKGEMSEVVEILAVESGVPKEKVLQKIISLHEVTFLSIYLNSCCLSLHSLQRPTPDLLCDLCLYSLQVNPMLGLRGCRLGIVHPEISEMQVLPPSFAA